MCFQIWKLDKKVNHVQTINFYERMSAFFKDNSGKLYRLNYIKRVSDSKIAICSCDPISIEHFDGNFFMLEKYVLEMLESADFEDVKYYNILHEGASEFLTRIGISAI